VIEAVGAFGYAADQVSAANDLTVFHAIGVALWPVGFVAVVAMVAFVAGGFIFGY
jgi:hypothetical protein